MFNKRQPLEKKEEVKERRWSERTGMIPFSRYIFVLNELEYRNRCIDTKSTIAKKLIAVGLTIT